MKKSLGLIEIKGLASAYIIADAMAKTASITIVGIESCKGSGWQTIKILGDVAAVQAALSTGSELAKQKNCFVAQKTLSRPSENVLALWAQPKKTTPSKTQQIKTQEEKKAETSLPKNQPHNDNHQPTEETMASASITCNLCNDPKCPRIKGEAHSICLHYQKVK